MLALIAGAGTLPGYLHERTADALVCELEGFSSGLPDPLVFRLETLGSFLQTLVGRGITEVCFAGAVRRPNVDPARVDAVTAPLVPRIMSALRAGDDGALREFLAIFEEAGLQVRAAHEIAPELLPKPGILSAAEPDKRDTSDAARAAAIHAALAGADVGQACVVAAGQALAVETLGGTDWMLATLAGHRRPDASLGGVLYKAPKAGQDLRVDMPVIGPDTIAGARAAGLGGVIIAAGGVMVPELKQVIAACDAAGLFLWVRT